MCCTDAALASRGRYGMEEGCDVIVTHVERTEQLGL